MIGNAKATIIANFVPRCSSPLSLVNIRVGIMILKARFSNRFSLCPLLLGVLFFCVEEFIEGKV